MECFPGLWAVTCPVRRFATAFRLRVSLLDMKKAAFIVLWMLAAWFVGCMLFLGVVMVTGFARAAEGDDSPPHHSRLLGLLIVYTLPAVVLALGIKGLLPGTASSKATSSSSNAPPVPVRPVIPAAPGPPVLPPPLPAVAPAAPGLSREQMAAVLESVIQRKFGSDRALLSPELFEALLRCVVDKKTFEVVAGQSGRPSEQEVAAFERTVGFSLPQDYRRFAMSGFGCLFLEVKESIWPRPKAGDIVPAWHVRCGLYVYGLSAEVPDFVDVRKQFSEFSKGGRRIVPFLRIEGSLDHYCFSPEGGIVEWRADLDDTEPVDLTFTELLLKEITSLQDRAKRIQTEPNPYA